MDNPNVTIQYQDMLGNWIDCSVVPNQSPIILQSMRSISRQHEGRRVRAVDQNGKLIDML